MSSILGNAYIRVRPDTNGFEGEAKGHIGKAMAGLAAVMAKGLALTGAAVGAAGVIGVKTAAQMETARIGFETMLGSAEKADKFLRDLQAFAAKTPFEFPALQTAASSLVSIGIDANKVIPIMTTLGNVTSGMGTGAEGVQRATIAIQQMNAAGRITAEDLNQLRDAGIPVFDLLAGATGKAKEELAAMAQNGKLGRQELDQLMSALETGKGLEKFNGLMEKQSQSLSGLFSTLKDTIQLNLAEAVQPFIPALKSAMDAAAPILDSALDTFAKKSAVMVAQMPNLFGAIADKDAQGIGEVLDNMLGNTGEHVGTFRAIAEELLPVADQLGQLFGNVKDILSDLGPAIGMVLAGNLRLAWEAFQLLLPALVAITGFLADNEWAIWALVGAYSALKAATLAHSAAMAVEAAGGMAKYAKATLEAVKTGKIATSITKAWTAVQWLWNAAMSANPIGLIIVGIAALIAGLVLAYQKSEVFRKIVDAAFKAIGDAAKWLWEKALKPYFTFVWEYWTLLADGVMWAWNNLIKPAWDAIASAASWLWNSVLMPVFDGIVAAWNGLAAGIAWAWENIISPIWSVIQAVGKILLAVIVVGVIGPLLLAWKGLSAGIAWAWENVLKPAWQAVQDGASWMWNNVLMPVFGYIRDGWNLLLDGIRVVWESVLKPAWQALQDAANWMWTNVLMPVFDAIKWGWDSLLAGIRLVYDTVLKPTWDALQTAAQWMWDNVLKPVFDAIGAAWDNLLRGMAWVYEHVIKPVWGFFTDAIDGVKRAFETAIDAIGAAWGKIKEFAAKPINFVIGTVLNDGLFKAFNSIIDTLGLPGDWKLNNLPLVQLAAGGQVPGYSPNDKADNIHAMLTAGEWVQPVSSVDYYGSGVMEAIRQRKIPREALNGVLHRADGGPVYQQLYNKVRSAFPQASLTSGFRPGDPGYHGKGMAVDLGKQGEPGGVGSPYMAAINRWIYDNFKAATTQLIYNGSGDDRPNILNGQDFAYDAATQAGHRDHVHWASQNPALLGEGGGGGFFDFLGKLKDSITAPLKNLFGQFGDNPLTKVIKEVPGKMLDNAWEAIKNKASDFLSSAVSFFTGGDDSAGGVKDIVRSVADQRGWGSGSQWDAIDWIVSRESGWNPNAANPSSSARGLFQKMTSIHGPLESTVAGQAAWGLGYMASRYGTPVGAKAFWERNNWYSEGGKVSLYDNGGVLRHGDTGVNLSGKPEAVLTHDEWKVLKGAASGDGQPLVGSLTIQVGEGASVKDGLAETMFQLRRIKRGGALK